MAVAAANGRGLGDDDLGSRKAAAVVCWPVLQLTQHPSSATVHGVSTTAASDHVLCVHKTQSKERTDCYRFHNADGHAFSRASMVTLERYEFIVCCSKPSVSEIKVSE